MPLGTRLYAVLERNGRHRAYRTPTSADLDAAHTAAAFLERFDELDDGTSELPDEPVDPIGYNNLQNLPYGYTTWRSLFTDRQLAVLGTLCRTVRAGTEGWMLSPATTMPSNGPNMVSSANGRYVCGSRRTHMPKKSYSRGVWGLCCAPRGASVSPDAGRVTAVDD